jgi:hypothetical protein
LELCLVKTKSTFEINNLKKRDVTMLHAIWLGEITIRHGQDGGDFRSGLLAADVDPVFATDRYGAHGVFGEIVAELKFWVFQEEREFGPKRQRIVRGFSQGCASRKSYPGRMPLNSSDIQVDETAAGLTMRSESNNVTLG